MKKFMIGGFASALLVLAACGGAATTSSTGGASTPASTPTSQGGATGSSASGTTYDILVWVAEATVDFTKTQLNAIKTDIEARLGDGSVVNYTVNPVGEGDAASNMITDVEKGADIYTFAQDQLARLYTAGALTEIKDSNLVATIKNENDASAVGAVTFSDKIVAFPMTSDNGYFLYYDKSVLGEADIQNWTNLLAKANEKNKTVYFNAGSAWYNFGFFYGGGADSRFYTDEDGQFARYEDTYATKGLIGAKGLLELVTDPAFVDDSSAATGFGSTACAVVSGIWDYKAVETALGQNLGAAALPMFTVNGQDYHTGSFSGNKLIGVKPQTDTTKAAICQLTAQALTNEATQLARFNAFGWGPSNKVAAANEAVLANPALAALAAQNNYARAESQYPGDWWNTAGAIPANLKKLGANATDAQIQGVLDSYASALDGMVG